jgi:hypothetical protein
VEPILTLVLVPFSIALVPSVRGLDGKTRGDLPASFHDEQTTENQEWALREVAVRSGHEIVAVYRDEGISGAKGRDKRPGFDAMHKDASRRKFDIVMAWSVDRLGAIAARPDRLLLRVAQPRDRPCPTSTGHRHHDTGRQGHVPDDGRVCRV